jgi:hypothetical protein
VGNGLWQSPASGPVDESSPRVEHCSRYEEDMRVQGPPSELVIVRKAKKNKGYAKEDAAAKASASFGKEKVL